MVGQKPQGFGRQVGLKGHQQAFCRHTGYWVRWILGIFVIASTLGRTGARGSFFVFFCFPLVMFLTTPPHPPTHVDLCQNRIHPQFKILTSDPGFLLVPFCSHMAPPW